MSRYTIEQALFAGIEGLGKVMTGRVFPHSRGDFPTQARFGALFFISRMGPQNVKDVAVRFGMTPSAATQLVSGLDREGLVRRREDGSDRRKIIVELTPKGGRIIAGAKKKRLEQLSAILKPLTETELSQLQHIIEKITEHTKRICSNPPKNQ